MNVHKLEIMVIDFDDLGAESVKQVIENARFPNDCIYPQVIRMDTRDIGEWEDDNPLNCQSWELESEFDKVFWGVRQDKS